MARRRLGRLRLFQWHRDAEGRPGHPGFDEFVIGLRELRVRCAAGNQLRTHGSPVIERHVHEFGTVPLSLEQWGVCIAMGSGVLWFSELRKWALRAFVAWTKD